MGLLGLGLGFIRVRVVGLLITDYLPRFLNTIEGQNVDANIVNKPDNIISIVNKYCTRIVETCARVKTSLQCVADSRHVCPIICLLARKQTDEITFIVHAKVQSISANHKCVVCASMHTIVVVTSVNKFALNTYPARAHNLPFP